MSDCDVIAAGRAHVTSVLSSYEPLVTVHRCSTYWVLMPLPRDRLGGSVLGEVQETLTAKKQWSTLWCTGPAALPLEKQSHNQCALDVQLTSALDANKLATIAVHARQSSS
jgi:hypothetical protein